MNKKTEILIGIIAFLIVIAIIVFGLTFAEIGGSNNSGTISSSTNSDSSINTTAEAETSTKIEVTYTSEETKGTYGDYTASINLSSMSVSGSGASISETTIKITSAGTYYFTGMTSDANIVVEADKDADVILVFDNVNITSTKTAVINGIKANSITVNLAEGSSNTFTDSSTYTVFTEDDEPNATVFSKTDLIINGSGKLTINANYQDAIASKDTLKIVNTNLVINAADDGIRGKDSVTIKDSNITIKSSGDGIKSTNTDESLGYVVIDGGTINIETARDGIQAESVLTISNATITIKTTGNTNQKDADGESISSKGLKAGKEITVNSGNITINSTDDSIHSNGTLIINGGTLTINSGDDGIHADGMIVINGGTFNITAAEGIEATYVKINEGTINISASDDGINAGRKSNDYAVTIEINGGYITIKMGSGDTDGIDSNGNLYINGGTVDITGNSAFDYDGTAEYNGGTIIVNGTQINSITNQFMGGGMNGGGQMNQGTIPQGDLSQGGIQNGGGRMQGGRR